MHSIFSPLFLSLIFGLLVSGCQFDSDKKLPEYQEIPDFKFVNQDSQSVSNVSFEGKAYVSNFFFTSCPTTCPKMAQQLLRIHDHFATDDRLHFLSHTIDTKRDSIPKLKQYAENLGVHTPKWHFVTGEKSAIYEIAESYFNLAIEDPTLPDGFDHTGRLVLVDKNRKIRAFCNGTDPNEVDQFMKDIEKLFHEDNL